MTYIKVASIALNQKPLEWLANRQRILAGIDLARSEGASILVMPELAITGYGCEDAFTRPDTQQRALDTLEKIIPETRGCVLVVGLPVLFRKTLFNCAAVIADGTLLGLVAKRYLAGDGVHYEQRQFRPWPEERVASLRLFGERVPIGDIFFVIGGVTIGVEICEDAWLPTRPGSRLAAFGVDVIASPNASHFSIGKLETRKRFVIDGSRRFNCGVIYSNLLGNEAGRIIYDGGSLIASGGQLIAQGPRLSFQEATITVGVLNIETNRALQSRIVGFQPSLTETDSAVYAENFEWPEQEFERDELDQLPEWENSPYLRFEEFTRAAALGLFDYLRKSRMNGFTVCLSGGADSTMVTWLISFMVRLGIAELGLEGFKEALSYIPWMNDAADEREIMFRILHTIYLKGEGSTSESELSAREVATAVGARFRVITISDYVKLIEKVAEEYLDVELDWNNEEDDIILQNIPARVRGTIGWTLANAAGHLLVPPSDLSEVLVGYFTQGGDDSGGGPNPLGVRKTFILRCLLFLEQAGPRGFDPTPALNHVNLLQPSPELRPTSQQQTAEDDLGPYPLRDHMQDLFMEELYGPVEIFHRLRKEFPEIPIVDLHNCIRNFFSHFAINQWKRERLAVTFHLDDHNLDPKSWLRWPVLSGCFGIELDELSKVASSLLEAEGPPEE